MVSQDRIRHWVRLCLRCLLRLIASLLIWAFALFLLLTIADNIWGAAETDTITLSAGYTLFIILGPTALAVQFGLGPSGAMSRKRAKNPRIRNISPSHLKLPQTGRVERTTPI